MQLSGRLRCIAGYIYPGERVIDVGTDHAYLPIWLLKNHVTDYCIATDLRAGPLERALADAKYFGVEDQLKLIQCDGLAGCEANEADTIVIAGMGGETMMGILAAAPWTKHKRLILQPQTKQSLLRCWLSENGYAIVDAALASDSGRIYIIWLVTEGHMQSRCCVEEALIEHRDPLLRPYLDERIKRQRKMLRGASLSNNPDTATIAEWREDLKTMESIRREAESWQT